MSLQDLSMVTGTEVGQQTHPRTPFYGMLQRSGLPLVESPYIVGGIVSVNWADIEPANGVFNFEKIDQKIHPWARANKRVGIEVLCASTPDLTVATPSIPGMKDIWGVSEEFNESIPQWLYGVGLKRVTSHALGSVHPHEYWSSIYLNAYTRLIGELAQHYDGHDEVLFVRASVGCDGRTQLEDPPAKQMGQTGPSRGLLWRSLGYSEAVWLETICTILSTYRANFTKTPTVAQIVYPFIRQPEEVPGKGPVYRREDGSMENPVAELLNYSIAQGMWVEYDCRSTDIAPVEPEWHNSYLIVNPRKSATVNGRPLMADLHRILAMSPTFAIIHGTDIQNPRNKPALEWASSGALY